MTMIAFDGRQDMEVGRTKVERIEGLAKGHSSPMLYSKKEKELGRKRRKQTN